MVCPRDRFTVSLSLRTHSKKDAPARAAAIGGVAYTVLSVYHFGHTTFRMERNGLGILVDPILARHDFSFARPGYPEWLSAGMLNLGAVLISHAHDDHLHPPSLLGIPVDVPIYIYGARGRRLIEDLGFTAIHVLQAGDVVDLGEGITLHAIPARPSAEGTEQCCFIIDSADATVLDAVDILDAPETREALLPHRQAVDLAFVPTGASVQWQGFWNQMDPLDAVSFCEWLQPTHVAPCGGSLSLADQPRLGTLSRYPVDFQRWIKVSGRELGVEPLFPCQPPFRADYERHTLRSCTPISLASGFTPGVDNSPPPAILTTLFTGYDPKRPTLKVARGTADLQGWAEIWPWVKPLLESGEPLLVDLIRRCKPSIAGLPATTLAPCTVNRLIALRAYETTAKVLAKFASTVDPLDTELQFFGEAEIVVATSGELSDPERADIATCLWLDRRLLQLRTMQAAMRSRSGLPASKATELLDDHIHKLSQTIKGRRPRLSSHHLLLTKEQLPFIRNVVESPLGTTDEVVAGVVYASPEGLRLINLSVLEYLILQACDGRRFTDIVNGLSADLKAPVTEVEAGVRAFLLMLARSSVLLLDWSD